MKRVLALLLIITSGCDVTSDDLAQPAYVIDGIAATVQQTGDEAVVTLDTENPSDWDGQQKMVQRALEAAGVLTGCYASPKPDQELDAYIAGAQPVRIAVDLQCF